MCHHTASTCSLTAIGRSPSHTPVPSLQLPPPELAASPAPPAPPAPPGPPAPLAPTVPSPHLCQLLLDPLCSRWVPKSQWWVTSHSLIPQATLNWGPKALQPGGETGSVGGEWLGRRGWEPEAISPSSHTSLQQMSRVEVGRGQSKNPRWGGRPDPFLDPHCSLPSQPPWDQAASCRVWRWAQV